MKHYLRFFPIGLAAIFCFEFVPGGLGLTAKAQTTIFSRFPYQDTVRSYTEMLPLALPNGAILVMWASRDTIFVSRTTDGGVSWGSSTTAILTSGPAKNISAVRTLSGRIIAAWFDSVGVRTSFSDNEGQQWSQAITHADRGPYVQSPFVLLSSTGDSTVWISYGLGPPFGTRVRTSTDYGVTWSAERNFSEYNAGFVSGSGSAIHAFAQVPTGGWNVVMRTSTDGGQTWSPAIPIANTPAQEDRPRARRLSDGRLMVLYQRSRPNRIPNYSQFDIVYKTSSDEGNTWSVEHRVTRYVGNDSSHNVTFVGTTPFVTFSSDRWRWPMGQYQLWYGLADTLPEVSAPPIILNVEHARDSLQRYDTLRLYVDDDSVVTNVAALAIFNGTPDSSYQLYDDGLHGDRNAGDFIWGCIVGPLPIGTVNYLVSVTDNEGNAVSADAVWFINPSALTIYTMNINRISMPLSVLGSLGYGFPPNDAGRFDGVPFLFAGGFFLSGKSGATLWANGVAVASRVVDYVGGPIAQPHGAGIFVLDRNDEPFGGSWDAWRVAVRLGADFYDGDNDSQYNPIDLNNNGRWDPDEDAPDLLGDRTAWCVYNDGLPSERRRFGEVSPQGIEIHQSVFAWRDQELEKILFVRYRIINRGTVAAIIESVYFGLWQDYDLGDYTDDLVGCDTLRGAGICWNDGPDNQWGSNPPAVYAPFLQGPVLETGNMADTAFNVRGPLLGRDTLVGFKNIGLTSFINYVKSDSLRGDANDAYQARNYLTGRLRHGSILDPCNDPYGSVFGQPCAQVNRQYWYSGDPVVPPGFGWVHTFPADTRQMQNAGPFRLVQNQPVDIIVAYAIGRGTDARNSVAAARLVSDRALTEYLGNFQTVTSVPGSGSLPVHYRLEQNYPNPFNPSTTIKFQLPTTSHVTLKVYDVLGREVATLVNEVKQPGVHEVVWNAAKMATGVYFYRMKAGGFVATKKLLLLK